MQIDPMDIFECGLCHQKHDWDDSTKIYFKSGKKKIVCLHCLKKLREHHNCSWVSDSDSLFDGLLVFDDMPKTPKTDLLNLAQSLAGEESPTKTWETLNQI